MPLRVLLAALAVFSLAGSAYKAMRPVPVPVYAVPAAPLNWATSMKCRSYRYGNRTDTTCQ